MTNNPRPFIYARLIHSFSSALITGQVAVVACYTQRIYTPTLDRWALCTLVGVNILQICHIYDDTLTKRTSENAFYSGDR